MSEWVSEWLLFNTNWAIYQVYHDENKLIFNEMMMRSARLLSWIFIVLAHWNNSLWIDMWPYLNTLSWFWANQSLLLLLKACVLSGEAPNTNFIVIGLTEQGSIQQSIAPEASTPTIAPEASTPTITPEASTPTITPLQSFNI
jgi:hypothetical protein